MRLYLVSQYKNNAYDTYNSMIVSAKNIDNAKKIYPEEGYRWCSNREKWIETNYKGEEYVLGINYSWVNPEDVEVEEIGTSNCNEEKIILTSFNAG